MDKTIVIIGFVQSLFGILIFISKRPRHLSFSFLAVWLGAIAIFLGALLLPFQVVDYFKPGIFPILFLFGPLLYLYLSSLSIEDFKLKPVLLMHLIPVIATGIHRYIVNPVAIGGPTAPAESTLYFHNKLYYSLLVLSLFAYWIFSLKLIIRHRKNIPNYFSNYTAKNSLGWLVSVLTIFLLFFVFDFSMSFINRVLGGNAIRFSSLPLNLTIFAFIMIFFGINQSGIYKTRKIMDNNPGSGPDSKIQETKYSRSSLDKKMMEQLTQTVLNYLKSKKPYLNPDYSLQMMVDDLNVSRHKLSQVINSGQKKNFYKFINEFRVMEVKEMLVDPEYKHYSVLGIGFECGFNSKTTFNRIFKEETGMTPTDYVKTLKPL